MLKRHGLITPQPQERPESSLIRFAAQLPNELWQADTTHWQLADGSGVETLNCVGDHSRLLLIADAFVTVKAADVVHSLAAAWLIHGLPAALLTDNGAVFSGKPRKGKVLSSPNSNGSASSASIPRRTARRPAKRWNASTKPSSAI